MNHRETDFIIAQRNGQGWQIHGLIDDREEAIEYARVLKSAHPKGRVMIARRTVVLTPHKYF